MEKLVNLLKNKNQTISCMESCTGGFFASEITNVDGSSKVFKLGLVTYSNEYKEYFNVSRQTINEYTVYSNEVSREMSKSVCSIAKANFGIGVTGMLGTVDPYNKSDNVNVVYISIYDEQKDMFYDYQIQTAGNTKAERKMYVVNYIKERLYEICK